MQSKLSHVAQATVAHWSRSARSTSEEEFYDRPVRELAVRCVLRKAKEEMEKARKRVC